MSNFINDNNKNLLLDLLLDKNKRDNREYVNNIINILNTSINEILNKYSINILNNLSYESVLNLNRELILLTKKKIELYDISNLNNITINVSEREKIKQKQFDDNLLKKEKEFDSYKPVPPKNISFKDEIDDKHIGDEMDSLISKAVEMREKQIKELFTNYNSNQENILKNERFNLNIEKINNQNQNIRKVIIGEETFINENIIDLTNNSYSKSNETFDSNLNVLFNSLKIKNDENISENKINNTFELLEKKIDKLEYLLNNINNKLEIYFQNNKKI